MYCKSSSELLWIPEDLQKKKKKNIYICTSSKFCHGPKARGGVFLSTRPVSSRLEAGASLMFQDSRVSGACSMPTVGEFIRPLKHKVQFRFSFGLASKLRFRFKLKERSAEIEIGIRIDKG